MSTPSRITVNSHAHRALSRTNTFLAEIEELKVDLSDSAMRPVFTDLVVDLEIVLNTLRDANREALRISKSGGKHD